MSSSSHSSNESGESSQENDDLKPPINYNSSGNFRNNINADSQQAHLGGNTKENTPIPSTFKWIMSHEALRSWISDKENGLLWVSGGPGKGIFAYFLVTLLSIYLWGSVHHHPILVLGLFTLAVLLSLSSLIEHSVKGLECVIDYLVMALFRSDEARENRAMHRVLQQSVDSHSSEVKLVLFSPDSQRIVSASKDSVILWDAVSGEVQKVLRVKLKYSESVVFSDDGKLLASASKYNDLRVWDAASGDGLRTTKTQGGRICSAGFSQDNELLASGSSECTVKLGKLDTGELLNTLSKCSRPALSFAFSRENKQVAVGYDDDTVRIWGIRSGTLLRVFRGRGEGNSFRSVALSPDGCLVAGISQCVLYLWDRTTGVRLCTVDLEVTEKRVSFSEDETHLKTNYGLYKISPGLISKIPNRIRVEDDWVLLDQEKVVWIPPEYRARSLAVDGNRVAIGSQAGRVMIMELNLGNSVHN